MYIVEKVITYKIRDRHNYTVIKDGLTDELTATFMANALNELAEHHKAKIEEKDKQISELRSVLPT